MSEIKNHIIRVYGIVQGVGFRPFVSRIADAAGVKGSVANKGSYVEIFAKGDEAQMAAFLKDLRDNPPERSAVLKIDIKDWDVIDADTFEIIESEKEAGDIFVSPDIATCKKCAAELYDKNDRRYMHPFINCTACGPRLTILDSMPYDRVRTSMGEFPMCPECEFEYTHAETRRYDAQPVCCNDCGPEVYVIGIPERGRDAITLVRKELMAGKIVAIKGIGGFHLACDATNEEAVARLRVLKTRPAKPFAVMMKNLETVRRECTYDPAIEEIIDGHQKPIILLNKSGSTHLAESVAPDNPKVGVMLPYAPVQMLIFDYNDDVDFKTDCLVMTSGNVSGAPICRTDEDAVSELSSFCDIILSHNRKIRLRADDSVMDFYHGKPYMIRRSRGYAPLPVMLSENLHKTVVAVGGELKNTFCIGKNSLYYPSPYVGDMADIRTVKALEESIKRMEELLEAEPVTVACDMHPKYNTTFVAEKQGIPVIPVQHHYAHIVSCMAENDYSDKVIGVSFDGTGYGTDGTIWGGEIMVADYKGFERVGYIRPFNQVGGDLSAKEGWRIAVSMINSIYGEDAPEIVEKLGLSDAANTKLIANMAARGINSVVSTSAGRLFDAVSAILGVRLKSTFEGEASTTLMFRAMSYLEETKKELGTDDIEKINSHVWDVVFEDSTSGIDNLAMAESIDGEDDEVAFQTVDIHLTIDDDLKHVILATEQIVKFMVEKRLAGTDEKLLAYMFHLMLADQIVDSCDIVSQFTDLDTVALSGGVFQNTLLLELCEMGLHNRNFKVLKHSLIPPNDGGIALGQAVVAMFNEN